MAQRPLTFSATVQERWLVVPVNAKRYWGEARPRVVALINGQQYRQRLAVYDGETVLGLTNAFRAQASLSHGDVVEVTLERDELPLTVDVPPELEAALATDATGRELYDGLSFTHRREYADWVGEAKQAATRRRRATQALERLRENGRAGPHGRAGTRG